MSHPVQWLKGREKQNYYCGPQRPACPGKPTTEPCPQRAHGRGGWCHWAAQSVSPGQQGQLAATPSQGLRSMCGDSETKYQLRGNVLGKCVAPKTLTECPLDATARSCDQKAGEIPVTQRKNWKPEFLARGGAPGAVTSALSQRSTRHTRTHMLLGKEAPKPTG